MKKYKSKSKRVLEVFPLRKSSGALHWHFRVRRRDPIRSPKEWLIIAMSDTNGYSRKIDCISTAKLVTGGRLKVTVIK